MQGFRDALEKGALCGNAITGVRFVLKDGATHMVDSSEMAFRLCAMTAFRTTYSATRPTILEPIMTVEVVAPVEFQSELSALILPVHPLNKRTDNVIGSLTTRRGTIVESEVRDDEFNVIAEVPLNDMFGYSSNLRGGTQGKGEFSMEYKVNKFSIFTPDES